MALFKRAGDDRTMLEHVKSLMACDKKGGFALVEGVDWVPLTCLEEVRALSLSLSLSLHNLSARTHRCTGGVLAFV